MSSLEDTKKRVKDVLQPGSNSQRPSTQQPHLPAPRHRRVVVDLTEEEEAEEAEEKRQKKDRRVVVDLTEEEERQKTAKSARKEYLEPKPYVPPEGQEEPEEEMPIHEFEYRGDEEGEYDEQAAIRAALVAQGYPLLTEAQQREFSRAPFLPPRERAQMYTRIRAHQDAMYEALRRDQTRFNPYVSRR